MGGGGGGACQAAASERATLYAARVFRRRHVTFFDTFVIPEPTQDRITPPTSKSGLIMNLVRGSIHIFVVVAVFSFVPCASHSDDTGRHK